MKHLRFSHYNKIINGLSLGVFILLAACGGDVTTSGGSGGSGGAGGSGGSNPTGGGPQQACLDFCHKLETSGCMQQVGDCTEFCGMIYGEAGAECAEEVDALFECWLPSVSTCPDEPPAACEPKVDAMEACKAIHGCGPTECMGAGGPSGETECGCSQTCAMVTRTTACKTDANGGSSCDCSVNGMSVGTCQEMSGIECGIQESCCAMLFPK